MYSATNDRLTSRTDPAGTTSFGYDAYSRINSITTPFSATAVGYTFDAAGRQLTRTDPSGLTTTRVYDTPYTGRLLSETVTGASSASFSYTYDAVGNVKTAAQTMPSNPDNGTWTYGYDAQNRLNLAQLNSNPSTTYTYDGAGNRTQAGSVTTTYDSAGLPISSSDGTTYGFDAVGDLTSLAGPRTWTFTYDSWSRTKTAAGAGNNPNITYTNDGLNRMTKRVRSGVTTNYTYVGTGEDTATTVAGSTTTKYAYDSGGPVAQSVSGTVKIYIPNLHGDLALIATTSGGTSGTQAYKPYGEKGATTGVTSYFTFQSDPTDSDTGLVDMGARLYDPLQGRFSSRDSLFGSLQTPQSLNQYVYGGDNPVSMVDPDGMCPRDPDNQSGCGYTMDSGGKSQRYDTTYGHGCWDCETVYSGIHGHEVVIPPPPPRPPKPVVMLNATSAAYLSAWSARMNSMTAINNYATANQSAFDKGCNWSCKLSHGFHLATQTVGGGIAAAGRDIGAVAGGMAVGLDLLGFPEVGEAAALISAAGYGLAATGDEIRGHYRAAAYESAIGAISALTAGIGSEALRAADYENPSLEMRVASRVTDLVRQAVGIGVWWAAHVVDESKYLPS